MWTRYLRIDSALPFFCLMVAVSPFAFLSEAMAAPLPNWISAVAGSVCR